MQADVRECTGRNLDMPVRHAVVIRICKHLQVDCDASCRHVSSCCLLVVAERTRRKIKRKASRWLWCLNMHQTCNDMKEPCSHSIYVPTSWSSLVACRPSCALHSSLSLTHVPAPIHVPLLPADLQAHDTAPEGNPHTA